jgi:hypothetical protein
MKLLLLTLATAFAHAQEPAPNTALVNELHNDEDSQQTCVNAMNAEQVNMVGIPAYVNNNLIVTNAASTVVYTLEGSATIKGRSCTTDTKKLADGYKDLIASGIKNAKSGNDPFADPADPLKAMKKIVEACSKVPGLYDYIVQTRKDLGMPAMRAFRTPHVRSTAPTGRAN